MGISEELQPQAVDLGYPFERILVPLDGSASAERALSLVRSLGGKHGTHVVLARVVAQPMDTSIQGARTYLGKVANELGSQGIDARTVVRVGPVPRELLQAAVGEGASLIAMSTHGGLTPESQPFGTVAEELFGLSSIPILAVPSRARAEHPSPLRTMLFPVDSSDTSEALARIAIEFAVSFGIDLAVLLAVVPRADTGRGEAEERVDAEAHLGRLAKLFEMKQIPVAPLVQAGDPVREILRAAREQKADVLALGFGPRKLQGDAGDARLVESILKESEIPVLAARRLPKRIAAA